MLLWLSTFLAFLLSLTAKILADLFLDHRIPVIGSFVGLELTHNAGVAFGVQFGGFQTILIVIAFVAILHVAVKNSRTVISRVGFGMILGGALGNIADRLPDRLVTDFFQVGTFPVFNVADSCITVGVGLLILEAVLKWCFVQRVPTRPRVPK